MISIIIPVHNTEMYLERCVQSVLANTYKDLEIVLVENGSTDRSLDICRNYEKEYTNVRVIVADRSGVSHARNLGIDAAQGEYIAFLDSDDYVSPYMYEKLLDMITDDVQFSFCTYKCGTEWNCDWKYKQDEQGLAISAKEYLTSAYLRGKTEYLAVWNKVFCASFLQKNRIYFNEELTFSEDREFMTRCAVLADKMIFVNDPLYYYFRRDSGSACQTLKSYRLRCDQVFSGVMSANFIENNFPDNREWADYVWACVLEEANFWWKIVNNKGEEILSSELLLIIKKARRKVWEAKGLPIAEKVRYLLAYYAPWLFDKIYRVYKFVKK